MESEQTAVSLALINAQIIALQKELRESEAACLVRDKEALERIRVLEAYKSRTEKYGFFLMGMIALGSMIAAGFEKVVNKIMGMVP